MIDTHTHLYDEAFKDDFEDALDRAASAGVEHMIFPGIDSSVHWRMMECASAAPDMISTATGLHPTSEGDNWNQQLDFGDKRLAEGGWTAIGEIGIDRHWSDTYIREQTEVFRQQMIWASEASLPVIIHVRDALDTVFEVLDSLAGAGISMRGVFHAFSGSIETFRRIKTYGDFKTGIGGVVTYRNAGIARTVQDIPMSDILLETDSPWLTPVPYRGRRNEPAYLGYIAGQIAGLKGISSAEVESATTANAKELFNLK